MEVIALGATVLEEVFGGDNVLDGKGGSAGDRVSLFEKAKVVVRLCLKIYSERMKESQQT